jgi:hypothetical protein
VTLTLTGANFVPGATVNFNGTALPTTFVSWSQITVMLPAGTAPGTYQITVTDPAPSGGTSMPFNFIVPAPAATCAITGDSTVSSADVQAEINMAVGRETCTAAADLNENGICDFGDVQRVVNASLGEACVVGPGYPPPAPTGLTAVPTQTTASLSWTAPPAGIAGYEIAGSAIYDPGATTSYTITGLTAGTAYSFYLYAYNGDGDISAQSQPISFTTAGISPVIFQNRSSSRPKYSAASASSLKSAK